MDKLDTDKIKNLFGKLAERLSNENDLSDVTWAFCETYPKFKEIFLSFFFNEINEPENARLTREFSSGSNRPDFLVETDEGKYIIEVKINDRNQHFEDYYKEFNKNEFLGYGYITNYSISEVPEIHHQIENTDKSYNDVYKYKTWEEFYKKLNNLEFDSIPEVKIYQQYLLKVCNIIKFETMNLSNLNSLFYLNKAIYKTIKENIPKNYSIGSIRKNDNDGTVGYWFYLNKENQQVGCFEFNVYFFTSDISISIGVPKSWSTNIQYYDKLKNIKEEQEDSYQVSEDEQIMFFKLNKNKMDFFLKPVGNKSDIADYQMSTLRIFFNQVMKKIIEKGEL